MTHDTIPSSFPKWGYLLEELPYPQAPGGRRLTVNLFAEPTGMHFDPYKAVFPVIERITHGLSGDRYALSLLTVEHPWEGRPQHQVAAGRVRVLDHEDREEVWFTFGGTLTLERQSGVTTARLISPAPILEVGGSASEEMVRLLADEAEELLAQRRAAHLPDHLAGLAARMAKVDPWLLYCVVLHTLEAKFEALPEQPVEERFLEFLRQQIQILREAERCPHPLPRLQDLL